MLSPSHETHQAQPHESEDSGAEIRVFVYSAPSLRSSNVSVKGWSLHGRPTIQCCGSSQHAALLESVLDALAATRALGCAGAPTIFYTCSQYLDVGFASLHQWKLQGWYDQKQHRPRANKPLWMLIDHATKERLISVKPLYGVRSDIEGFSQLRESVLEHAGVVSPATTTPLIVTRATHP